MRRVSQDRTSAPINLKVSPYSAELNRDDVGIVNVDNPAVSRSQPDFHHATQVVSPIDLSFSTRREPQCFMKGVSLRDEWTDRLILRTVDVVAADSILVIQGRRIVRVRKVGSRI